MEKTAATGGAEHSMPMEEMPMEEDGEMTTRTTNNSMSEGASEELKAMAQAMTPEDQQAMYDILGEMLKSSRRPQDSEEINFASLK